MNRPLMGLATDPEQYTHGDAVRWMMDDRRQKEQRERFWNAIKPFLPPTCQSALDIGCGSGWIAELLFNVGISRYSGIEPSLKNYKIAKRLNPDLDIQRATFEEYSSDTSFDCVLAIMVISHIQSIGGFFKKIHDFMNNSGVFIVITSSFFEAPYRYERDGKRYEIEVIDDDQYVAKSIEGTGYGIADIKRTPEYYIGKAEVCGLDLVENVAIEDKGHSPKLLLVFRRN